MSAWASLNQAENTQNYRQFWIRFNVVSGQLLHGFNYVYVRRTDSGKFMVITPITDVVAIDNRYAVPIHWSQGKYPIIFMGRMMNSDGMFPRSVFDGRRCKVKKDKKGRIFICMEEVVE